MHLPHRIRRATITIIFAILITTTAASSQEKPQSQATIDLKPLGAAPDLFSDQSDSKYQQRGVLKLFWVSNDRIAVAFSTNRRWSDSDKPGPLNVRLVVFDPAGKPLQQRDWAFSADGPAAQATLEFAPGPDQSILAIHEATADPAAGIPEGNLIQVLDPDTSLRQNFYVPATSVWLPTILPDPKIVLQTYYTDKHTSLAWWSGHPLKPSPKLDLPRGGDQVTIGPGVAARMACSDPILCAGVRLFRADGRAALIYPSPSPEIMPLPQVFLNTSSLLVELVQKEEKEHSLVAAHADGTVKALPPQPKGLQTLFVTSVSSSGDRFNVDMGGEKGVCGGFGLWCRDRVVALVFDVPANRIVFQQDLSPGGGISALSPDGRHVAIFDRNKLSIFTVP